jgi:hypothetical protein
MRNGMQLETRSHKLLVRLFVYMKLKEKILISFISRSFVLGTLIILLFHHPLVHLEPPDCLEQQYV